VTVGTLLEALVDGTPLADDEIDAGVEAVFDAGASPIQVAGLLVALRVRGEGPREIVAFARALRARMKRVGDVPAGTVDTCGTGGDGAGTFNVSTAAALVVAGAGVPVAKHGNRAVSGRVGSADVLEALGVRVELPPERLSRCLAAVGIVFLHAPSLHPAMGAIAPTRRALGIRTIFNVVGPLANPAGVRRQVVGVPAERWLAPMATALTTLGTERAWVVHGYGGLDELALDGPSVVLDATEERIRRFDVDPASLGLVSAPAGALRVASIEESAKVIEDVLGGTVGPARDIVCLNAAAALVVADRVEGLEAGLTLARRSIDDGAAARALARLVAFTTEGAA
jgi:anthranilate phosphoribosyltransferase